MKLSETSDTRLVFRQEVDERRLVAIIAAPVSLALGAAFVFADGGSASLFGYLFVGCGLFFAVFGLIRNPAQSLIIDREVGDMTLRVPKPGGGRRVIRVALSDVAGVTLLNLGNSQTGYYDQVEFVMRDGSPRPPLRIPSTFTGMSHADIHATITQWAERTGAFGATPDAQIDSPGISA